MLQLRGNNAFKCFRNCRQFEDSSIVLWSGIVKESFQIVGKTDDEIDKWKSLRMGLQIVRAQN